VGRERIGEVPINGETRPIELDPELGRLEVQTGDPVPHIALRLRGSKLTLIHTEVPAALRGHGIGETMARAALDYARSHHLTVLPFCPFVRKFIERHPQYQDLVDPEFSS
jgi:uncharacterized protein